MLLLVGAGALDPEEALGERVVAEVPGQDLVVGVGAPDVEIRVDAATLRYVGAIAANAPLTLRAANRAIAEVQRDAGARDVAAVNRLIAACFESADYAEGVRAFLEKRPARFTGR